VTTFGTPAAVVERGPGGMPLIKLAEGSDEVVPYDRASSYGKAIDNGAGLLYWAKCMVVKGAAMSPSIVKAARPLDYYDADGAGKKALIELAEKAMTLAGSSDKATEGTAMHSYTELIDKGQPLPDGIDAETLADLDAYRRVTAGLAYPAIETFVVTDEVRVAGTFDRIIDVPDSEDWPVWLRGKRCIGDLKTGNAEGAIAGILVQLAIYSRGKLYNPATGARTPLDVDRSVGLVVHLPLGKGEAQIIAVDLSLGWAGVLAAQAARAFQGAAKLGCKSCFEGSGFYKNGNPCRSCKGVPRTPCGVTVRKEKAA
jgi:hypothetical protein